GHKVRGFERRTVPCRPRAVQHNGAFNVDKRPRRFGYHRSCPELLRESAAAARQRHDSDARECQRNHYMKDFISDRNSDHLTAFQTKLKHGARQRIQHEFKLRIGHRFHVLAGRANRWLFTIDPALKENWIDDIHGSSSVAMVLTLLLDRASTFSEVR